MFIKEKFKARCEARMRRTQAMAAKKSPWLSSSSDGFDDEDAGMDDDENPEDDLDDEVRISLHCVYEFELTAHFAAVSSSHDA
jgi:hypothetical protein